MPKVSIIVPVYNSEKYIKKCLDSLINQTLKDIEIICVDDGSVDNSLNILNEYATQDLRIKVLSQENSKQGAARNRGIEIASGEFITYVDSDDWVDLDYCELLYNAAVKYNVDIAAASTTRDYKFRVKNHLKLTEEKVYHGVNNFLKVTNLITHGKLYRLEPIKSVRFEENVFYEDAPYSLRAFCLENSLVTVPEAHYHYYSNPASTMKQKLDIKRKNDKISTNLDLIKVAEENKIDIGDIMIYKDAHILWAIKHYKTHQDFYLFGIKLFSKKVEFDNKKTFVLYNTACLGDVLLCNSLCQNIKNIFPESKVVFVVDKKWEDAAKYQKDVDEVIIYDKNGENKGFFGLLKFVHKFKYKKAYASIITYRNERNFLTASLTGSKSVLLKPTNKNGECNTQKSHNLELSKLTNKKVVNYPIKYEVPDFAKKSVKERFSNLKDYAVLCTISKRKEKDMPINTIIDLIKRFNSENKQIVLVGTGEKTVKQAEVLRDNGCIFEDLVNKTTIPELGAILENANSVISVDTGTLHFAYAVGTPVVGIFYEPDMIKYWAPNPDLYKSITISSNYSAENIHQAYKKLVNSAINNSNI